MTTKRTPATTGRKAIPRSPFVTSKSNANTHTLQSIHSRVQSLWPKTDWNHVLLPERKKKSKKGRPLTPPPTHPNKQKKSLKTLHGDCNLDQSTTAYPLSTPKLQIKTRKSRIQNQNIKLCLIYEPWHNKQNYTFTFMTTLAYRSFSESSWVPLASLRVTQSMTRSRAVARSWTHCLSLFSETSSSFPCWAYWEGSDTSFHKALHFYLSAQLSSLAARRQHSNVS